MKTNLPAREVPTNPNLPVPEIPLVPKDNLNLADLGNDELVTYITYPGIKVGHVVSPNFRGRATDGMPVDMLEEERQIDSLDAQQRYMIEVPNTLLLQLDGGHVFYSFYRVENHVFIEQSLRHFFFVNKSVMTAKLPVIQLRQSHALQVDLKALGSDDGELVVLPYQAMAEKDRVTFEYQAFYDGLEDPLVSWDFTETITQAQVGQPIFAQLPNSILKSAKGLTGNMFYRIAYSDGLRETVAPIQLSFPVAEVLPAPDLLEPPTIKDLVGENLDPDDWPEGVIVQIPFNEGMAVGAGVVLFVDGKTPSVQAIHLDPSSVDSERLEFHLAYPWLRDRRGQDISLSYAFGAVEHDGRSQAFALTLAADLKLAPASVDKAVPDEFDDSLSWVGGWDIAEGAVIRLPPQELPPNPTYTVYWEGHEVFSTSVPIGPATHFAVPKRYIPANLGKQVRIHYDVQLDDGKRHPSPDHYLMIKDFEKYRWRTIQTPGFGNEVSLAKVDETAGLPLVLDYWFFMDKGQRVHIEVAGKVGNHNQLWVIRDEEEVTESEAENEQVKAAFKKSDLKTIDLNTSFEIRVRVSFDGGLTYKDFTHLSKVLVA